MAEPSPNPYRQIRASYDDRTITVYQAYSASIAEEAVASQKLHASPDFSFTRMTWIKPSWCWMMYRSGYSTKDARQSHILALRMTHENFHSLLAQAVVCHGAALREEEKTRPVRVQWDPERGPALEVLSYRSIQIGIGEKISRKWAEEWIESIEDVTDKALGLKKKLEDSSCINAEELIEGGWMPLEPVLIYQCVSGKR
ncbi:hypothetical protein LSUB1_G007453 [Lachnellula subtilissima]|uniref:ATP-dependent RNA helicase DHX8 n=1 Tax=Lachnellula subtilissima TaxID=602034 RepID=A0A8H8U4K7_9HELO|nr:hypothetical protein LSUB1_G007453 [Lachnellula subtilissima]